MEQTNGSDDHNVRDDHASTVAENDQTTGMMPDKSPGDDVSLSSAKSEIKSVAFDENIIGPEDEADDEDIEPAKLSIGKDANVAVGGDDGTGIGLKKKRKKKPKSKRGLVDHNRTDIDNVAYVCCRMPQPDSRSFT